MHFYPHYFIAGIECIILAAVTFQIFNIYVPQPYFDGMFINIVFIVLIIQGMSFLTSCLHIESWEGG
jgi:hypothetical protein